MISGIFFFWDTLTRWHDRKEPRTRWIIGVNLALLALTLWLLSRAGSATSNVCLVLGCLVIAAAHSKPVKRHLALLSVLIPVGLCLYLLLQFGFGVEVIESVSQAVGRDPTLTDRTLIWSVLIETNTNPLVGTGFESFWLGPRLYRVWERFPGINEAHNGYLESYLSLGIVGLIILAGFLIASYRNIFRNFTISPSLGSLSLAMWVIIVFYNVTESAFLKGSSLLWIIFLLGAVAVPRRSKRLSTVALGRLRGHQTGAACRPSAAEQLR